MIKTDYIKCLICNDSRTFHKSGIQSHFKSSHKISWLKYKQNNLNKFCEVCGKKLLLETQRFCSYKCSGFVKMFYEGKPLDKLVEFFKVPVLCIEKFKNDLNLDISKVKNYKKCVKCDQYIHYLGFGSHYKSKHKLVYREEQLC